LSTELNSSLPLNLVSFRGSYNGNVQLTWRTTNEVNTKQFIVERSNDGRAFKNIGTVLSKNLPGVNDYSLNDANPLKGVNYYRLKMIDKDGASTYSSVVTIEVLQKNILTIHSNPVHDVLVVSYSAANAGTALQIVGVDGKTLITVKVGISSTQAQMNVGHLNAGTYFLQMQNDSGNASKAFIKQ
jgi:hypothetical protein